MDVLMMDFHLSARLIGNNRVHRLIWRSPRQLLSLKLLSFREFIVEVRRKRELYAIGSMILLLIVWLLVWSIQFELIYPQLPFWSRWVTGDPLDVLWYCVGAAISSLWWWFYYQRRLATQAAG